MCALWFPRATAKNDALIFAIFHKITKNCANNVFFFAGNFAKVVFTSRKNPGTMQKRSAKRLSPVAQLGAPNASYV